MTTTRRQFILFSLTLVAVAARARFTAAQAVTATPPDTAERIWADLMAGNQRFVAATPRAQSRERRAGLAKGQNPRVIVLSCSDSRVSPTLAFDQGPGDLFVIRTAGNVADTVALGSIEYAVATFTSPLLVVLGHDSCGAVRAALAAKPSPSANLEAIVRLIAPAVNPVKGQATGDALDRLATEANVRGSARHVTEQSAIVGAAIRNGSLTIVRAVYRLASGEVARLT